MSQSPSTRGPRPQQDSIVLPLNAEVDMVFRHIPLKGQTVRIGSRKYENQAPVRKVRFEQDWYLGETVVTQTQWRALMKEDEVMGRQSFPDFLEHPLTDVSWEEALAFCTRLHEVLQRAPMRSHLHARLPTEAEWEAACRAGAHSDYWFGDGLECAERLAWTYENSAARTHPAWTTPDPSKPPPHPWGLLGMHGNVWEWCEDLFYRELGWDSTPVAADPCHIDPEKFTGDEPLIWQEALKQAQALNRPDAISIIQSWSPEQKEAYNEQQAKNAGGPRRVLRGGSWLYQAEGAIASVRVRRPAYDCNKNYGFRVCLSRPAVSRSNPQADHFPRRII